MFLESKQRFWFEDGICGRSWPQICYSLTSIYEWGVWGTEVHEDLVNTVKRAEEGRMSPSFLLLLSCLYWYFSCNFAPFLSYLLPQTSCQEVMQHREFCSKLDVPTHEEAVPLSYCHHFSLSFPCFPASSALWLPLCRAEVMLQRGAELRGQSWEKIRTYRVIWRMQLWTTLQHSLHKQSSSPPFKMNLLYSCSLSGAALTRAMFESCQGISEREGIDTNQKFIKDVRSETLFVATAQSLNWLSFHHRHSLIDQGSNAHFNMHPNWS